MKELAGGDAGDSITDAHTALQEMFRLLGIDGNSAGAQARKAINKGLLLGHDIAFVETITTARI